MGDIVTLKKSIAKYIYYKVNKMISTYRVYGRFQYISIDFNKIIQDTIEIPNTIGDILLVLSSRDCEVILEEIPRSCPDRVDYTCRIRLKPV